MAKEYTIPTNCLMSNSVKKYRERINEQHEIKMKIDHINPKGGIERLQKYLSKTHPDADFYVLELTTRTLGAVRHTCIWRRERASASNANITSLHLAYIDNNKALDNYSQEEMWAIAGSLPDDKCRLRTGVVEKKFIVCDPV